MSFQTRQEAVDFLYLKTKEFVDVVIPIFWYNRWEYSDHRTGINYNPSRETMLNVIERLIENVELDGKLDSFHESGKIRVELNWVDNHGWCARISLVPVALDSESPPIQYLVKEL